MTIILDILHLTGMQRSRTCAHMTKLEQPSATDDDGVSGEVRTAVVTGAVVAAAVVTPVGVTHPPVAQRVSG